VTTFVDIRRVDCVSFETMRRNGVTRAFALERHFRQQGFSVIGGE
jgi:predicted nucleic acid-binding protein